MKFINVTMRHSEKVLPSYLKRVFMGEEIIKGSELIIRIPEDNIINKYSEIGWSKKRFRNFCTGTANNDIRITRTRYVRKDQV